MLNYETLLSSYDDKLTLMQWLKKVEAALKDASAVAFNVTKTGDATLTFSIDFEDGSKLESDPIVLQQGESVASAYIQNGHLHLVLTNGDDLDAGTLFNGTIPQIDVTTLNVSGSVSTPTITAAGDEISAQKPVVEVMTGYTFYLGTEITTTIYAGVCKNGNKITFVWFGSITPLEPAGHNYSIKLGSFIIPQKVGNKLYPYTQGGLSSVLDSKTTSAYSGGVTKVPNESYTTKDNATQISLYTRPSLNETMAAGTTYLLRYEVTFLLSDNLAA